MQERETVISYGVYQNDSDTTGVLTEVTSITGETSYNFISDNQERIKNADPEMFSPSILDDQTVFVDGLSPHAYMIEFLTIHGFHLNPLPELPSHLDNALRVGHVNSAAYYVAFCNLPILKMGENKQLTQVGSIPAGTTFFLPQDQVGSGSTIPFAGYPYFHLEVNNATYYIPVAGTQERRLQSPLTEYRKEHPLLFNLWFVNTVTGSNVTTFLGPKHALNTSATSRMLALDPEGFGEALTLGNHSANKEFLEAQLNMILGVLKASFGD